METDYGHPIILKEVEEALAESTDGYASVIIGVRWGSKISDVEKKLIEIGCDPKSIRKTDNFISTSLNRKQIDSLAKATKLVFKIWYNNQIKPMWEESCKTISSLPAFELFKAEGEGIDWAVLDTGIMHTHNYFKSEPKIVRKTEYNFTNEEYIDTVGHGTHVAGIIRKLAPKTRIHDFKVLGANGGTSFMLIDAMYNIRKMNLEARKKLIHGINLSLGGPVPVGSYGCGFSPECQEANLLVESGVVVCVAASNDGYKTLATIGPGNTLEYYPKFMDLGISDPGNAEKVITVGSVHKTYPHSYGVSWFSSKGPTGDGRFKPDVVAPGEKIKSAFIGSVNKELELNGTSMATPHVSAAIAQFLSVKSEFIGRPDLVKKYLMENCTDLGRDRNFQGAGLINVLRMIQAV